MTKLTRIVWTRNALADLEQVRAYLLENADPDTMRLEAARIWTATQRLTRFPASGRPGRIPETRELVVAPYILPYRIKDNVVEILDVFHSAQKRG